MTPDRPCTPPRLPPSTAEVQKALQALQDGRQPPMVSPEALECARSIVAFLREAEADARGELSTGALDLRT